MIVWYVHCEWYDARDITIGIFTNLAFAAREAMKYVEDMCQNNEVLTNRWEEPWGFTIDITQKVTYDLGDSIKRTGTDFTGQLIFEHVTLNHLS